MEIVHVWMLQCPDASVRDACVPMLARHQAAELYAFDAVQITRPFGFNMIVDAIQLGVLFDIKPYFAVDLRQKI